MRGGTATLPPCNSVYSFQFPVRTGRGYEVRRLSDSERRAIARGADEIDPVYPGLEETMAVPYQQIRETWKGDAKVPDLRTADFICAINKVATCYRELGIFP